MSAPRSSIAILAAMLAIATIGRIGGVADAPSLAPSEAELLPPWSRVDDLPVEGGGFVRAPDVAVTPDGIALRGRSGTRVLPHVRAAGAVERRLMLLGTDQQGRDVAARLARGAWRSLAVALWTVVVALVIGAASGLASAFSPPALGGPLRLTADAAIALPRLLLLLLLAGVLRGAPGGLALAIGLASWMDVARITEADARAWRSGPAALAARASGASETRIAWRHAIPNLLPVLATMVPLVACEAVLLEATLGYLGVGAGPGDDSWGRMIADGQRLLGRGGWIAVAPGVLLVVTAWTLRATFRAGAAPAPPKTSAAPATSGARDSR